MIIPPQQRILEFYRRLKALPPARDHDEAFARITHVLNEVEDELTNIVSDPSTRGRDGRLYPPQPDSERPSPDSQTRLYRTKAHVVQIGNDGSIRIMKLVTGQDAVLEFYVLGASR
jgi:hypothetical protein